MDLADLVPVCSVNHPTEAEIIRSALESAGIPCQIGGETQAGLAGVLEIEVLTRASDADRARKYLRSLRHVVKEDRKKAHEEAKHAHETHRPADRDEATKQHKPPEHPTA